MGIIMSNNTTNQMEKNRAEESISNGINSLLRLGKDTVLGGKRNYCRLVKDTVLGGIKSPFELGKDKALKLFRLGKKKNKVIKVEIFEAEENYYKPITIGDAFSSKVH